MIDIVQNIIILCIILICLWAMYRVGVQEGRHRERMLTLYIISKIGYEGIKDLNVLAAQNLLLDRLRKMWD